MTDRTNVRYDAIVVGSGHNGLIAAAYLARAGKKVLVLERRGVIGGATVTEEPWPGYRISTCSYVCNLLLPEVIRDLGLVRHGYDVRPLDPQYFIPFPDGGHLISYLDGGKTAGQIAKFSKKDVAAYGAYWSMWDRIIARMRPLLDLPAPTRQNLERAFDGRDGEEDWRTLTKKSVAEVLDEYFESEELKAVLCVGGVIGTNAGPRTPGTAYVKYHHILGGVGGHQGAWGYVRGGMGAVSQAIASSAREAGAEILTNAEVAEIDIREGVARGVHLRDGRSFGARVVLSGADPHRTYLGMVGEKHLPEDLVEGVKEMRVEGSVVKVLLALGELPDFSALPGKEAGPQHTGGIVINPSVDSLQEAWEESERGEPSARPFIDGYIQSATEDGLAPPGKHTMSLFCQYAPYRLARGTWEGRREEIGQNIIRTLAEYAPNVPDAVEGMEVLGPPDIEARIGITGGNIFHGEILPDSMFADRPVPGYGGYRTPIENLYLCGAGTWPGGAVFGAPGRNCAREVLGAARASPQQI
ncbi:NAD(P)-binding protein [Rubrobacter tropicus]|uniref:Pyridine nucleotide-disulfide oxidoreductase domain-containing protein 2 n=1 Tax=Rubrobacter tropicus TaxID=2653851 RepID=A0A6G8QC33_9ACTN|nr:NAD(P)/FAD-dependent oxidoreductase [Rubrobacter tropicus]QIN84055.1 NAD(P)-binding protein [Rubrobacter tropicus]